jgi:hypothetical protein
VFAVSVGKGLRASSTLIVQTELTHPGSVDGILKAIVSPEPAALAWFIAQRSESFPLEHELRSAVVVTVRMVAARAVGGWKTMVATMIASTTRGVIDSFPLKKLGRKSIEFLSSTMSSFIEDSTSRHHIEMTPYPNVCVSLQDGSEEDEFLPLYLSVTIRIHPHLPLLQNRIVYSPFTISSAVWLRCKKLKRNLGA